MRKAKKKKYSRLTSRSACINAAECAREVTDQEARIRGTTWVMAAAAAAARTPDWYCCCCCSACCIRSACCCCCCRSLCCCCWWLPPAPFISSSGSSPDEVKTRSEPRGKPDLPADRSTDRWTGQSRSKDLGANSLRGIEQGNGGRGRGA